MTTNVTAPIILYKAPHRTFNMSDLYGMSPTGAYIPNPKDHINLEDVDRKLVVTSVDYAKYTWETRPWGIEDDNSTQHIVGAINYLSPRMYRFYIDDSKSPPTINFDGRLGFSPFADSIRVFLGTDISKDGDCISGYMRNGELQSTSIPMVTQDGLKFPLEGIITRPVNGDNIVATMVVYKEDGTPFVVDSAMLIKTAYISKADSPAREILDVELVSPWLSSPSSNLLRFPINLPYDDMLFAVKITYSDGTVTIPMDGSRAALVGLENAGSHDSFYIASNAGHELDLTFSYRLGKNELYRGPDLVEDTIVKDYRAVTEVVDGAYSLKLFVVPEWVGGSLGWRLRYFLYDLRRGNFYDATDHVRGAPNSSEFDPTLYNHKQPLIVSVNVKDVSAEYKSHQHAQSFTITLINEGTVKGTNYIIGYQPTGEDYGRDLYAEYVYDNVSYSTVGLSCKQSSLVEWLHKLYTPIYPLYDRAMEAGPLNPTHFVVKIGEFSVVVPITDWYKPINVPSDLQAGSSLTIHWIRREPKDDLELGVSSLMIHRKI